MGFRSGLEHRRWGGGAKEIRDGVKEKLKECNEDDKKENEQRTRNDKRWEILQIGRKKKAN